MQDPGFPSSEAAGAGSGAVSPPSSSFQSDQFMSALVIQSGSQKGKKLVLPPNREVLVGRDEDCQIRLASSLVSRRHCTLEATPAGIRITDLQSQNGTFVNDVAITTPTVLAAGDLVRIGSTQFQVAGPKPAVEPSVAKPAAAISEHAIADWLSDDEIPVAQEPSETTVLTHAAMPAPPATAKQPTPPADEAAEVIRRHWAAKHTPPG
jgi:pSer/pThr/pTyr-binding forkhead associated (FHA) protein